MLCTAIPSVFSHTGNKKLRPDFILVACGCWVFVVIHEHFSPRLLDLSYVVHPLIVRPRVSKFPVIHAFYFQLACHAGRGLLPKRGEGKSAGLSRKSSRLSGTIDAEEREGLPSSFRASDSETRPDFLLSASLRMMYDVSRVTDVSTKPVTDVITKRTFLAYPIVIEAPSAFPHTHTLRKRDSRCR